ncbi:DUF1295 domain-containing protein [Amycolatopsis samaneae]|uniref:DUF1295 domain-containing protein n=1 Tax=Amycolatopsis samaneae TaxID=664691 RepID=A0ABW5GKD6_9PSEU
MTAPAANLAITLAVTIALFLLVFAVAARRGRYDLIDSLWGLGFAIVAIVTFMLSAGHGAISLRLTVTLLTVLWGLRLAAHIHIRNRARPEDARYAAILRRAGSHPRRYMLTRVYLTQAGVLWFVSLPIQCGQYAPGPPGWPFWAGIAVWTLGFVFEAVGDHQLRRFRADPGNRGRVLDSGLWRYTRHPNYFGDACVWWGLYLLACTTWYGAATVLSPIVMTALLAKGTGKPLLERDIGERRPGYADYIHRTSGFLPLPPRRGQ